MFLCKQRDTTILCWARLVKRAEDWKWSSLHRREKGSIEQKKLLSKWPIDMPRDYIKLVNEPQTNTEVETLRCSVNKGKPYGSDSWVNKMIVKFSLGATLRNPGRPNKGS